MPPATTVPATPLLLNIPDAARVLGTTTWAIRQMLWSKTIPFVKIGKRYLIAPADLEAYVAQLKAGA